MADQDPLEQLGGLDPKEDPETRDSLGLKEPLDTL